MRRPLRSASTSSPAGRTHPKGCSSGQFRQVKPKDGAPASNKSGAAENKKSKG